MHHFFVEPENITEGYVIIQGDDFNHIKNVLRISYDEEISVYDGQYNEYICVLESYHEDSAVFEIREKSKAESELKSKLYLFQGLPKSDKMELIIQKAVELGVYEIIPVKMGRSIVKYDKKKESHKTSRWNLISKSAAKQSARALIPKVKEILDFNDALEYASNLDKVLVPYEYERKITKTKETLDSLKSGESVGIFIGPEGGFEDSEIESALKKGFSPISLGKRILRTETAGLCALSILMFAMED